MPFHQRSFTRTLTLVHCSLDCHTRHQVPLTKPKPEEKKMGVYSFYLFTRNLSTAEAK